MANANAVLINRTGVLNAAGHVAIAAAAGFAIFRAAELSGLCGLLIFGGGLAIYYGCRVAGKAFDMKAYQVKLIQAAAIVAYSTAVAAAFIALGVLSPHLFSLSLLPSLLKYGLLLHLAKRERIDHPNRRIHQTLPESFDQILLFRDPIAERIERQEAVDRQLASQQAQQERRRLVVALYNHLVNAILEASREEEGRRIDPNKTALGKVYYRYMSLVAKELLKTDDNANLDDIQRFEADDIEDMMGESYFAIERLAIFHMIEGIQPNSGREKIIFENSENVEPAPTLESDPIPELRKALMVIREKMQILFASEAKKQNWRSILLKRLSGHTKTEKMIIPEKPDETLKNFEESGDLEYDQGDKESKLDLLETKLFLEIYNLIEELRGKFDKSLLGGEPSIVWANAFKVHKKTNIL